METVIANEIKNVLPYFMKHKNVWTNYDKEADTLYMHFKKPNHADHSEMTEDEITEAAYFYGKTESLL